MCGIAGAVGPDVAERGAVENQVKTLGHRGPDSSGVYEADGGIIGQTRLAVIDLVTGDPPIMTEDGNIGVALNGEIYNYRSLRDSLLADGHAFRTATDTEVLAHLAETLDPAELGGSLDGMFAFAVWDASRQRLVLGRDRLGKKPLYYWSDGRNIVFGSEIKAVLAHPAVPRRIRVDAVPDYLTFGYVPTPETFYEGILAVPPGHVLVCENMTTSLESYWEPPTTCGTTHLDISFAEAAVQVRALLDAAVRRRLVADVPIGAFLSGGVDSSTVVALMALATSRVRTFSMGFDEASFDERRFARLVARRYATEHTEFVVRPDAVALVEELVALHDQPFGDSTALPTYLLSKLTREHVTVALCGDGGDELFAGYERFAAAQAHRQYGRLPRSLRWLVRQSVEHLPRSARRGRVRSLLRFIEQADSELLDAFRSWISCVSDQAIASMLPGAKRSGIEEYRRIWNDTEGVALLDRLLDLNLRTYLLDDLLPKVDRMSMAHALEVRSPFLDRDLVEFSLRLPPSFKQRGLTLKRVLKEAVSDVVPTEILRRPKQGFGVPLAHWFRADLHGYAESMMRAPSSCIGELLDPAGVSALFEEHQSGARDNGQALWTLLTLEIFLRQELR